MSDPTLFELPAANKTHPARYTDALLTTFARMLLGSTRILDPFGGTGKVFLLEHWLPGVQIAAIELEPEWARLNHRTTIGNALALPYLDACFDAVCVSPTYGSRMADHHDATDDTERITYTHKLGHKLHADNTGALQWGPTYRSLHVAAWTEARRVLQPGGRFVLNIKDHIRGGERRHVTDWHIEALTALGFTLREHVQIACPGMRWGANSQARVEYESVILFEGASPSRMQRARIT